MKMDIQTIIFYGIVLVVIIILFNLIKGWIGIYNKFQYWINRAKRKFADIDVVMQERLDKLHALAQIVKKYDEGLERISSNDAKAAEVRKEIDSFKEELDYDFIVEDIKNVISETRDGTERVATIVQDLKEFSHVDRKEEKTYTDINHWLDTTLNLVWNELKYNVELKKEYGEIPEVECYPHQLSQVFMNLLVNASQAIEDNGEIGIRTYTEEDRVFIKISDTGKGMSKELMNRIFEPFYTTKPVGKGTGLGLSVSYGIIEKHQGSLKVESEEGKGTTFTVEIPVNSIADEGDDHGDPTVLPG